MGESAIKDLVHTLTRISGSLLFSSIRYLQFHQTSAIIDGFNLNQPRNLFCKVSCIPRCMIEHGTWTTRIAPRLVSIK